jgi:hypothetical protein
MAAMLGILIGTGGRGDDMVSARAHHGRPRRCRDRAAAAIELKGRMERLRRRYFADSHEVVCRYGVSFERLFAHLNGSPNGLMRGVPHLNDLIHAVGCLDGLPVAWNDLIEQYERPMIRFCRGRLDECDAIILVRRIFAGLRARCSQPASPQAPSFHDYYGTRALRNWLADRLIGSMSQASRRDALRSTLVAGTNWCRHAGGSAVIGATAGRLRLAGDWDPEPHLEPANRLAAAAGLQSDIDVGSPPGLIYG